MRSLPHRWLPPILAFVPLALGGCGGTPTVREAARLPAAFADTTSELPRLRYADGELSLNDRCPVRKGKLNLRLPPMYVNGRPIGFC